MHCVWCRWALSELANSLRPQDRMKMQAKNYETLQEIASNFQKRALLTLSIQQQPVPLLRPAASHLGCRCGGHLRSEVKMNYTPETKAQTH